MADVIVVLLAIVGLISLMKKEKPTAYTYKPEPPKSRPTVPPPPPLVPPPPPERLFRNG